MFKGGSSGISFLLGLIYGVFCLCAYFVFSIYAALTLYKSDAFQEKLAGKTNCLKKLKSVAVHWFKNFRKRRRIYYSALPHTFDQATDLATVAEYWSFLQAARRGDEHAPSEELCRAMFVCSIAVMCLYRLVSANALFSITHSLKDAILQVLFDFGLYKAMLVSYKLGAIEPTNPQRFLQLIEVTIEATPQMVMNLIFILKTGATVSPVILLSLIWSIGVIVLRVAKDDPLWLQPSFSRLRLQCLVCSKKASRRASINCGFADGMLHLAVFRLNAWYLVHFFCWRFLEIMCRLMSHVLLLWSTGYLGALYILSELLLVVAMDRKYHSNEFMRTMLYVMPLGSTQGLIDAHYSWFQCVRVCDIDARAIMCPTRFDGFGASHVTGERYEAEDRGGHSSNDSSDDKPDFLRVGSKEIRLSTGHLHGRKSSLLRVLTPINSPVPCPTKTTDGSPQFPQLQMPGPFRTTHSSASDSSNSIGMMPMQMALGGMQMDVVELGVLETGVVQSVDTMVPDSVNVLPKLNETKTISVDTLQIVTPTVSPQVCASPMPVAALHLRLRGSLDFIEEKDVMKWKEGRSDGMVTRVRSSIAENMRSFDDFRVSHFHNSFQFSKGNNTLVPKLDGVNAFRTLLFLRMWQTFANTLISLCLAFVPDIGFGTDYFPSANTRRKVIEKPILVLFVFLGLTLPFVWFNLALWISRNSNGKSTSRKTSRTVEDFYRSRDFAEVMELVEFGVDISEHLSPANGDMEKPCVVLTVCELMDERCIAYAKQRCAAADLSNPSLRRAMLLAVLLQRPRNNLIVPKKMSSYRHLSLGMTSTCVRRNDFMTELLDWLRGDDGNGAVTRKRLTQPLLDIAAAAALKHGFKKTANELLAKGARPWDDPNIVNCFYASFHFVAPVTVTSLNQRFFGLSPMQKPVASEIGDSGFELQCSPIRDEQRCVDIGVFGLESKQWPNGELKAVTKTEQLRDAKLTFRFKFATDESAGDCAEVGTRLLSVEIPYDIHIVFPNAESETKSDECKDETPEVCSVPSIHIEFSDEVQFIRQLSIGYGDDGSYNRGVHVVAPGTRHTCDISEMIEVLAHLMPSLWLRLRF